MERKVMTEEYEQAVRRHYGLVVHVAKKFFNTGVTAEELVAVGSVGLLKALRSYDPFRDVLLSTYAGRCIENEILNHLRYLRKFRKEVSLEEVLYVDRHGNEVLRSDRIGTEPDLVSNKTEEMTEIHMLKGAVRRLPTRERRIICLRYGMNSYEKDSGRTQKEVSLILGVSQSYISRMERQALKRLREELES